MQRTMGKTLEPIRPQDYQLAEHAYRRHSVETESIISRDDVANPVLYEHIGRNLRIGDEIRVLGKDMSYVAGVIVTFAQGSMVRVSIREYQELDKVDEDTEEDDYTVKLCGRKRWCLIKISTNETIREDIPSKVAALKELNDFRRSMAA